MVPPPPAWRIPLPAQGPDGPASAYLLPGEPLTLVDPGPCTAAARSALAGALAAHGLRPADIRQVVLTQPAPQAAGLAAWVHAESGAPVLAHPHAMPRLLEPEIFMLRLFRFMLALGARHGVPEAELAMMHHTLSRGLNTAAACPRPALRPLAHGTRLQAGAARWRAWHTPGHAGGALCLLRPEDGALLSGGHLVESGPSAPLIEPPGPGRHTRARLMPRYVSSLRRTERLKPHQVYPGFGEPFAGGAGACRRHLNQLERWVVRLVDLVGAERCTPFQLSVAMFRCWSPLTAWHALSTTLGLLDLAVARRWLAPVSRQGRMLYRAATPGLPLPAPAAPAQGIGNMATGAD